MLNKCFITTLIFSLFFCLSAALAQIPEPAKISGTLRINETQITHKNDMGYIFTVTRSDGTAFSPPAEDTDRLSPSDLYWISIPVYEETYRPGGAIPGDMAVIHVYKDDTELTVISPFNGEIIVGDSGSETQIDLTANEMPFADAGPDQTVNEGSMVALNGSASSDPDGEITFYSWRQIFGTEVLLSNDTSATPTFTAPALDTEVEALTFELTVTDNGCLTDTDNITVNVVNPSPVANAGPDQTVTEKSVVTLDGSGSEDPASGWIVSYEWNQTDGIAVMLSDTAGMQLIFTAPEVSQETEMLTFELIVKDNIGLEHRDEVKVSVISGNLPPEANAGTDQTTFVGNSVTLDGLNSKDPDGRIVSYEWEQISGTAVTLSSATDPQPTFVAPTRADPEGEELKFELTVTDNEGETDTDQVTVHITSLNYRPLADAGWDQTITPGIIVTLDASASSDPDDGIASYHWTLISEGIHIELSDATAMQPSFQAPEVGRDGEMVTFELTVTDMSGQEDTDEVTVTIEYRKKPPVADAGPDQTVTEENEVRLDGSASWDADGQIETYLWIQDDGEPELELSDPTAARPTFIAPEVGWEGKTFIFTLEVKDNDDVSDSDKVEVHVVKENDPPVADAGPDQQVNKGDTVTLDGSKSYDLNDEIMSYFWHQTWGTPVMLSNDSLAMPMFPAPDISLSNESLTFELTVTDRRGMTDTDSVTVTVVFVNQPPMADAGPDQWTEGKEIVTLDGSGSYDADDGIISYQWLQTDGTRVTLSDAAEPRPTFTVPDTGLSSEWLTFELTVTDRAGMTDTDSVTVNITWGNRPPVANAGENQTALEGTLVTLNGSESYDMDDGVASYEWRQTGGTSITLSNITVTQPTFTAPPVTMNGETLIFVLEVTDKSGITDTDEVYINITNEDHPPVADAGQDQNAKQGDTVTLDGSGSSDTDGVLASYFWKQRSGALVTLSDATSGMPSFVVLDSGVNDTSLIFDLTVTDDDGLQDTDSVTVNIIISENQAPAADAGNPQTVKEKTLVMLDASNSHDPDGVLASYLWKQRSGTLVTLSDATSGQPTFIAPDVGAGVTLLFELTVTDDEGLKNTDSVTVTVTDDKNLPPVADAGPSRTVQEGTTVMLDASNSRDTDGIIASYFWKQTPGASVSLSDTTSGQPTFIAPNIGPSDVTLVFELTVTDDGGLKSTDSVTVTVTDDKNLPPVADAGPSRTVQEGTTVMLDASNSRDTDGIIASYFWKQTPGASVSLSDATSGQPTFIAPNIGPSDVTLVFELTVTDDGGLKSTDSVTVTVTDDKNLPPVADAGPSRTVQEGTTVMLDASNSRDTDGIIASYFWKQTPGASVSLSDATSGQPTFIAPNIGPSDVTLVFELTVTDDGGLKSTDSVTVTVTDDKNLPPMADAGPSRTVQEGATVMLDASNSRDTDGIIASYFWKQTPGASVSLSDATSGQPTFIAPNIGPSDVTLVFELTVTDDHGLKDTDAVTVTVISRDNQPPIADAGDSQTVQEGDMVMLDASESDDSDGTIASYAWKQIAGTNVTLSDAESVQPTFLAPAAEDDVTLIFELTVTDDNGLKSTDNIAVYIGSGIQQGAPVADAGYSRTIEQGTAVTLDGSNSWDTDGGSVTSYFWTQTEGPAVTLSDPESAWPTFVAPLTDTSPVVMKFQVTVTDNDGLRNADEVTITISDKSSSANAGVRKGGGDSSGCFIETAGDDSVKTKSFGITSATLFLFLMLMAVCTVIFKNAIKPSED
ncbi:PKD domain-containing protein [Desulfonema magnum]|uniref:Immunoglobulin-like fold-containing n=1 Tax=Desulfonema magnum TaxID=45655 RepID=A0A975BEV9_9BACT|nr:PKD domain-containing protein [Desulfonema magnum]QTA84038.1 immunoglobulin-like fold-containing [Desulfonema magnum]